MLPTNEKNHGVLSKAGRYSRLSFEKRGMNGEMLRANDCQRLIHFVDKQAGFGDLQADDNFIR